MHIIGQTTFVIETIQPTGKFKNKTVMSEEGPVTVPDGEPEYEYMWFAGMGIHPDNPRLMGAIWTPYPEQAARYKDRDEATIINNKIIGTHAGGFVLSWDTCHKAEGRVLHKETLIKNDVKEANSINGVKGKNL